MISRVASVVRRRRARQPAAGTAVALASRAPIICRPRAAPWPKRIGWQLICALLWATWLLCWMPLLTLAIWEFGLLRLHHTVAQSGGLHYLQQLLLQVCMLVAIQSVCLLGWAGKDCWRFGSGQRRRQSAAASVSELARFAQLPSAALAQWQRARCLVAEHDDTGQLFGARARQLPHAAQAPRRYLPAPARVP